jgi:hypothetical protein
MVTVAATNNIEEGSRREGKRGKERERERVRHMSQREFP